MMKSRGGKHKVLASFSPEEILPFTGSTHNEKKFCGRMVKMQSLRYQCFKRNLRCACCGIMGAEMCLELPKHASQPHFNLYAHREGKLVLMTKDHIKPKSRGGKNDLANLRTMCCRCNELSGNKTTKLKRLREIQDGMQTVYTLVYGMTLDGFATSLHGLEVIARRWVADSSYDWENDSYKVQISICKGIVKIVPTAFHNASQKTLTLTIKPIRRV